jgi:hypothetical protein
VIVRREHLCKLGLSVVHTMVLIYSKVRFTHYSTAAIVLTDYQSIWQNAGDEKLEVANAFQLKREVRMLVY